MEWFTLATTLVNVIIPPAYNLIKGLFGKKVEQTPEETIGNLATTKPEVLAAYVEGLSKYYNSLTGYFNRDVSGVPSLWVINMRASIRPVSVVLAFLLLFLDSFKLFQVQPAILITSSAVIGNWIGTRIDFK